MRAGLLRPTHDESAVADDIGCENGHESPLYLLAGQEGPSVIAWGPSGQSPRAKHGAVEKRSSAATLQMLAGRMKIHAALLPFE